MIKRHYIFLIALAFLMGFKNSAMASGSGAFRVETPDAAAMAKGSAFVGEANTPAAVYYNPAGINQIKRPEISAGTAFLAPAVDYKPFSGDEVQMRRNDFWIPHVYGVAPIGNKFAVGVGATSYFGLGTEWAQDSPLRYDATKSSILNQDYMLTGSYQITDQWSFALSADNDNSKISKEKKIQQSAGDDANSQFKVKDDAWGYRIATMYKFNERHQFGLMYRSRITHKYEGKVYLDNLNNAAIAALGGASYQTVFGGTSYETKATEKFTLPQSVVLGYSYKPTNKWTFNFDVEWMDWSSYKHDAVNYPDETNATRLAVLNSGNPASRDWKSAFSESFGAEYALTNRLRLRGGYYHHISPIPNATWEASLPDANSHGITTGFGYDLTQNLTVDVAYSALIFEHRTVDNSEGNGTTINGTYKQVINIGLMTLTYKF